MYVMERTIGSAMPSSQDSARCLVIKLLPLSTGTYSSDRAGAHPAAWGPVWGPEWGPVLVLH